MNDDITRALRDLLVTKTKQTDPTRETGRQELQAVIGNNVFDGRLPRCSANSVLMLSAVSDNPVGAIDQPIDFTEIVIDVELYMRDSDQIAAAKTTRVVGTALRKWLHKFRGRLNARVCTQGIFYETGPVLSPLRASDASGNWRYRSIITYRMGVEICSASGVS